MTSLTTTTDPTALLPFRRSPFRNDLFRRQPLPTTRVRQRVGTARGRSRPVHSPGRRKAQDLPAGLAADPDVTSAGLSRGSLPGRVSGIEAVARHRSTVRAVRRGAAVSRGSVRGVVSGVVTRVAPGVDTRVVTEAVARPEGAAFAAELISGLVVMTLVLLAAILA